MIHRFVLEKSQFKEKEKNFNKIFFRARNSSKNLKKYVSVKF